MSSIVHFETSFARRVRHVAVVLFSVFALPLNLASSADPDWSGFRGPSGMGVSTTKGLPVTWGESENIVWKTPLPGADQQHLRHVVGRRSRVDAGIDEHLTWNGDVGHAQQGFGVEAVARIDADADGGRPRRAPARRRRRPAHPQPRRHVRARHGIIGSPTSSTRRPTTSGPCRLR